MATKKLASQFPEQPKESPFAPWIWYASGKLKACGLLREKQWIYACDDANTIYLLDHTGTLIAQTRISREITAVAAAENGSRIVVGCRTGHLVWLDQELSTILEVEWARDVTAVGIDPFGDYAVACTSESNNLVVNSAGKKVSEFKTRQPQRFAAFVPVTGSIILSAENGHVSSYSIYGQAEWSSGHWTNIGGMAVSGDGDAVLLAGFSHGILRYNSDGRKEGIYRLESSPCCVATDFNGTRIFSGTLEGNITELSYEGVIRATRNVNAKPSFISVDPLARYGIMGFQTGEIRFFTLPDFFEQKEAEPVTTSAGAGATTSASAAKQPTWETRAVANTDEADSAVMAVVPITNHLAVFTNKYTLRIFDEKGELHHESDLVRGVGRSLVAADNWLAAASDSRVLAYNPKTNRSIICDLPTTEVSHLNPLGEFGDMIILEACEYITRFRFPEKITWKHRLEYRADSTAAQRDGHLALTLEDKNLLVFNTKGEKIGKYRANPPEPLLVAAFAGGWATAARETRAVRGHDLDGTLLWSSSVPWIPWTIRTFGEQLLVTSADGQSQLLDEKGTVIARNEEPREHSRYFQWRDGQVARVFQSTDTLIVTSFDGKLLWRHTDEHRIGPFLAESVGVWVWLGRMLTFFKFD